MPGTMLRTHAGEPDGMAVLHDVARVLELPEDDAFALSLWLAVRRVLLWASLPAEARAGLLGAGTAPECLVAAREQTPELAGALDIFAALWVDPEEMEPGRLASTCNEVGRWATRWGLERTAVMFAEAAAAAEPENAARAIEAGETCQRLGGMEMWQRAEQWFQRAFGLALVAKHARRVLSIRALLAYGNWARELGKYALARWCYVKAARRARRYNQRMYYAVAHHNLLVLAGMTGQSVCEGEVHAKAALEHYPRADERLPHLAHDYAAFLNHHQLHGSALGIIEPLAAASTSSRDRLLLSGSLAWAAGGAGRRQVFEEAAAAALSHASIHGEFAADALRYVAEGALLLGDHSGAVEYAQTALRFALERDNEEAADAARQVLLRVAADGPAAPVLPLSPSEQTQHIIAALAARLGWPAKPSTEEPEPTPKSAGEPPRRRSRPAWPAPAWGVWGDVDTLAGLEVLHEVERIDGAAPDEGFALLLWRTLRRVHLWTSLPAERRAGLFVDAEPVEGARLTLLRARVPELSNPLVVFHALLHCPTQVQAGPLAAACGEVEEWARAKGLLRTAVFFAEAAAAAEPADVARAISAGESCQRCGGAELLRRAEEWFQRAFDLARTSMQSRRLLTIRALLAYGNWARATGDYPLARQCYEGALRRARRHGRWTYYAIAHHNLLVLTAMSGGDFGVGEAHAQAALDHYPPSDARLPHCAHDYAALLMDHNRYTAALGVFVPLLRVLREPRDQLLLNGSVARAAAGAGWREMYQSAVSAVLALAPRYAEFAADALLYVAEGALLLGDRADAAAHAATARDLAVQRADPAITRRALALLERIDSSEPAPPVAEVPAQASTLWLVRRFQGRLTHRAFQPR